MKIASVFIGLFLIAVFCCPAYSQTIDSFVKQAEEKARSGDIQAAIDMMREAVAKFPEDASAYAFLGGYLVQGTGQAKDMMAKAAMSGEAFGHLDKAVALDSLQAHARFFRGLLGVMVPPFMGKLDQGIVDLETVLHIAQQSPGAVSGDILTQTFQYLGVGYSQKGNKERARQAWEEVIRMAPDSDLAKDARARIDALEEKQVSETTGQPAGVETPASELDVARQLIDKGEPDKAMDILKPMVAADSTDAVALAWLGIAQSMSTGQGYDERIAKDTDFRTNAALDGYRLIEKAVTLDPDNPEVRLVRGTFGAELPSFMDKTDQSIEDLQMVLKEAETDEFIADALYALGLAYRRKALSVWEELITNYPESGAARNAFEMMKPEESFVEPDGAEALVVVRFAIGFVTELEAQTAVWVEDEKGTFVKTLYVSGFSGNVGGKQVVLPKWAESSKFETDANTAASIPAGWHSYVWDLTDGQKKPVPRGTYAVKVEVHHWPSMQYQLASVPVEIGKGEKVWKAEAGDIIPFLEARYIPGGRK